MIAKIIAYGSDRDEALARLRRAMAETTVIIEGGVTNKSFVLDLLDQPEVIDASADTGWIDRVRAEGRLVRTGTPPSRSPPRPSRRTRTRRRSPGSGCSPPRTAAARRSQHETGRPLDLKLRGVGYRVSVAPDRAAALPRRHRRGRRHVHGRPTPRSSASTRTAARSPSTAPAFRLVTGTHGPIHLVEVDGVTHRVSRDEGGVVRSPAPALVVATPLAVGDEVEADAPILVLESMKMETVLRSPFRARVRELPVSVGSQVETGAPLLRLEPVGDGGRGGRAAGPPGLPRRSSCLPSPRTCRRPSAPSAAWRTCAACCSVSTSTPPTSAALAGYLAARAGAADGLGGTPLAGEVGAAHGVRRPVRADPQPAGSDAEASARGRRCTARVSTSTRYLQSLDVERAGCPRPSRAGWPGCSAITASPAWTARRSWRRRSSGSSWRSSGGRRRGHRRRVAAAVAGDGPARRAAARAGRTGAGAPHRGHAAAFPSVSDLARGVVFRWFAQPLLRRNRARVYAAMRENLRYLDENPDAADRAERIAAMVASSEPLVRLIGQRVRRGADNAPLLEVLTRRYYGNQQLADVTAHDIAAGDGRAGRSSPPRTLRPGDPGGRRGRRLRRTARRASPPWERWRPRHPPTALSPTSTCLGGPPGPRRARGAPWRVARGEPPVIAGACRADRTDHLHGRRDERHRHAAPLHLPPGRKCGQRRGPVRGPADPRTAPADRPADADGPAA